MSEVAARIDPRNNKRFLSGIMFLGIGVIALYVSQNYPMGTALNMGPGYFPIVLSGILVAFGIWELIIGLLKPDPVVGNWSLRALCILPAATVIFGFLMERAGFIPAMIALIYVSAWAGSEFKFWEVTGLAVVLTAASVGLFIYGLGLPYPLLGGA